MTSELKESKSATARWEDEGGHIRTPSQSPDDDLKLELEKYGIVPVQLTVYEWGGYRYSSPQDAIAAAKRARG